MGPGQGWESSGVAFDAPQIVLDANLHDTRERVDANLREEMNLNDDLQKAFGGEFEFQGNFCTHGSYENMPSPVMTIEGLGLVGLPLTHREGQYIASHLTASVSGDGMAVDPGIAGEGTPFEVGPGEVSFQNPKWNEFVEGLALKTVWRALGAAQWKTKPKCELVKVSLHHPGSTKPTLQDSSNVEGSFATMVIILPCTFEGGQVRVKYQGKSKKLDVSKNAVLNTSVMAWYNEVAHEAKPLTSGYRLALTYNIIHTSPGLPVPSLSKMGPAAERVRSVLQRWRDQKYTKSASMPFRVYLLSRHYARPEVNKLQGADFHKVRHLLPLAKELGFTVSFSTLTYLVDGYNDEVPVPSPKRRKHGQKEEPEKVDVPVPAMTDIHGSVMSLSDVHEIVDIPTTKAVPSGAGDGNSESDSDEEDEKAKGKGKSEDKANKFDFGKVSVEEDVVIPRSPFHGKEPDEKKYDLENYGSITHTYKRTGIVLYRREDDLKLKLALKGDKWALEELQRLMKGKGKTNPDARRIAFALLEKLRIFTKTLYPSYQKNPDEQTLKVLIQYSWKWEDIGLWKRAFPLCTNYCVKSVKGIIDSTLLYFYVKDVLPSIKKLLRDTPSLSLRHRLEIVDTVARYEDDEAILDDLLNEALESYGAEKADEIETIVKAAKKKGLRVVNDVIVPKVAKRYGVANFFSTLLLSLHEHRAEFPTVSAPPGDGNAIATPLLDISVVIRRCLREYITQWNRLSTADVVMVQHITEVGMYVGEVEIVSNFLATLPPLIDHPSEAGEWYNDFVIPLMAKLRELMKKLEEEVIGEDGGKTFVQPKITQEPFRPFFKTAVCVYLAYILGGKGNVVGLDRKVGCGCVDCEDLDEWIQGPEVRHRFEATLGRNRLSHVEERLADGKTDDIIDMYDDTTTPQPHAIILQKKAAVVKTHTWAGRQEQAVKFMKHAVQGGEREMMELLGKGVYDCAVKAIHGVKPFELGDGEGVEEQGGDDESDLGEVEFGKGVMAKEGPQVEVRTEDEMQVDESKTEVPLSTEVVDEERPAKRKREA